MYDAEIRRLHGQGLSTGAIAIRLQLEPSHVRSILVQASSTPTSRREKAQAKVTKAQRRLAAAAAELALITNEGS
jgi:hypothetical protein